MRVKGDWIQWDPEINFKKIHGAMGIFEIADDSKKLSI